MKTNCNIIYDLLPLYIDQICSKESQDLVEDHLATCSYCTNHYKAMSAPFKVDKLDILKDEADPIKVNSFNARKALIKIRRWWIASILLVILMGPVTILSINQYKGDGVSFTNIYSIYQTKSMLSALKKGNYEKAFTYLDTKREYQNIIGEIRSFKDRSDQELDSAEKHYKDWLSQFEDTTYEQFYNLCLENFKINMDKLADTGLSIQTYRYKSVYSNLDTYQIEFHIYSYNEGLNEDFDLIFSSNKGKLTLIASSSKIDKDYTFLDTLHKAFYISPLNY